MATLALAAVGAAAGGALLPGGISLLGATLSGAAIGSQIGALAGSYVDNALFGASGGKVVEGPRLQKVHSDGLDGRRADPTHLWPRAAGRSGDLGRHSSRAAGQVVIGRQWKRATKSGRVNAIGRISLLRELCRGAVRGRNLGSRPGLG